MSSLQYAAGAVYQGNNLVTVYTQETMGYNVNGQLTSLNWGGAPGSQGYAAAGPLGGIQYSYPASGNNGQITQAVDSLSGENDQYQYDSLKRLKLADFDAARGGRSIGLGGDVRVRWLRESYIEGFERYQCADRRKRGDKSAFEFKPREPAAI